MVVKPLQLANAARLMLSMPSGISTTTRLTANLQARSPTFVIFRRKTTCATSSRLSLRASTFLPTYIIPSVDDHLATLNLPFNKSIYDVLPSFAQLARSHQRIGGSEFNEQRLEPVSLHEIISDRRGRRGSIRNGNYRRGLLAQSCFRLCSASPRLYSVPQVRHI